MEAEAEGVSEPAAAARRHRVEHPAEPEAAGPQRAGRARGAESSDEEPERRERPTYSRSIKDTSILRKDGETIEQMLRRFKRRCSELKIQSELKSKRYHLTKSEKRRLKSRKARRKRRR